MASLADLVPLLHAQPQPYAPHFDDRLLISLVVALASGHPSIVLRVGPAPLDDPQGRASRHELVGKVADEVAWICAFAFALSSHRVSCSPKLSSTAFLKALFAPPPSTSASALVPDPLEASPSRKDSFASRASLEAPQRRTPRRSLTGPLEVSVARANDELSGDPRRARSPSRLDFLRTPTSPTLPVHSPSSAPPSRISFSDLTGPAPDDGESSAGEDLYPSASASATASRWGLGLGGGSGGAGAGVGSKSASLGRRSALGARGGALGGSPSPDRQRRRAPGARRHTVGAREASGVGLGLGVGNGAGGEYGAPRPASPRLVRDGSGYFGPRGAGAAGGGGAAASLAHQHASYLEQADRRPSIASIASRASTATAASPVAPSGATPGGAGPASPLRAQHGPTSPSPLAASSLATPSSSSRPSSPSRPGTPTSPTSRPSPARPRPSSTYPPPSRPTTAAPAPGPLTLSPSFTATAAAHPPRALPQVLILEHLERARPSAQQALLGVLRDRRVQLGAGAGAAAGPGPRGAATRGRAQAQGGEEGGSAFRPGRRAARGVVVGAGEGEEGAAGQWDGTWNVPEGFVCVAIVWDEEGGAGREGWGGVSRHLLDRFTLSHTIPASSLLSSSRFFAPSPPPSPSPHNLVQSVLQLPEPALPSYLSDSLDTYTSDLVSALRHHPQLDGRMLTANAVRHLRRATRIWAALTKGAVLSLGPASALATGADEEHLDRARVTLRAADGADASDVLVLPADVLAVALSVVGHRLALRRPEDEKSLFWGSEVGALRGRRGGEEGTERGRLTVEAVVREVVAVV
ncbi:hypothetical protein JCM9279_001675 [Rhodotorula babjevae]